MLDYLYPIVIDNGSGTCKAGGAQEEAPSVVFNNIIGYSDSNIKAHVDRRKSSIKAHGILTDQSDLSLRNAIERGIQVNWDSVTKLWHHTFHNELSVVPEEHPVLLTQDPLNTQIAKEKMAGIMFEYFGIPAIFIENRAVLALLATGRTTGMVVQSGEAVTNVVPIVDGKALNRAITRLELGGMDISRYLLQILNERGHAFSPTTDRTVINDIKTLFCYVPLDYDKESLNVRKNDITKFMDKPYELPDGKLIKIFGNGCFHAPEVLFKPSLLGLDAAGIHKKLHASLNQCPTIKMRQCLSKNIVLSGGTTLLRGIEERLMKEMVKLLPTGKFEIIAPDKREYLTWIGGSNLASASCFQQMWITKQEYHEFGPDIINRKCC